MNDFDFPANDPAGTDQPLSYVLGMRAGEDHTPVVEEPRLLFVLEGELEVTLAGCTNYTLPKGYFGLLLAGDIVSWKPVVDSRVLVCRLRSERQLYERLGLSALSYFAAGERVFSLSVNYDLEIFLSGFVHFLPKGFSSLHYQHAKTAELLYVLRECYSKTDLAALFSPLLGEDLVFKNFVFSTLKKVRSVSEMASMANMSATGFRTKFTRAMGGIPVGDDKQVQGGDDQPRSALYRDTAQGNK